MDIPSKYDPLLVEDKWYKKWMDSNLFRSQPDDREPYTIVIPPPNVTGVLHMGHMLNNTIQDVLIRRARMMGKNACWVPGTDHASIATEARVVAKLKNEGIDKNSLSREEFLRHAWEWKEKHGGIILEQLKKLGASCDWQRTEFTMNDEYSESVIRVFVDLYDKNLIYRGVRMVNWDPQAKTAVSDEEVMYREENSCLYFIKYIVEGSDDYLTVATTRPETILGDTAVCVNPADKRFGKYVGKTVLVPLVNRPVPVISDSYVDMDFGSGCLKITPAHDVNDYEIGRHHNLKVIDIFNDDGTLNKNAEMFVGEDRFQARKLVVEQLKKENLLIKTENYVNKVGYSERTDAVIEPKLSLQWFLKMKELAQPALDNVMNDNIRLYPAKFKNTYKHWMENVKDWCISRQLWWGHRIPAWYIRDSNDFVVAINEHEAILKARQKTGNSTLTAADLRQDEDVLDTWFSSWLWPIAVFKGITRPGNADINYYYPTNDLITAPEILFFWVARMIIAGYAYMQDKPFRNVYLTGIVRDNRKRKMSKSLGNSPDPLNLIKKYSADGVRVGMLLCSSAGNDLLFDETLTEQGRNFGNKIWNAFRLVQTWPVEEKLQIPAYNAVAVEWFAAKLNQAIEQMNDSFSKFRISESLMVIYRLFWDDFSSWYLEIIKPGYRQPIDGVTYRHTISFFESLLALLHPFMPFITEEIWHLIGNRKDNDFLMVSKQPEAGAYSLSQIEEVERVKGIVTQIRAIRLSKNIPLKESLLVMVSDPAGIHNARYDAVIEKLCNLQSIHKVEEKPRGAVSFLVGTAEYFVQVDSHIDIDDEYKKAEDELQYYRGFKDSVLKKLSNERFVQNAPAPVVEAERKKLADAEKKISALEERLHSLKN